LLSQEKGPCGDEQRKAHAPKMPRDTLCARNTAAQEHANVTRGKKQRHGTKDEVRRSGISTL
jgi:hypothetical protein